MTSQKKTDKTILRTIAGFAAVLAVAVGLIALGNRNDAASEGERLKAGLLTAHEVRMAFQTVGGRLVDRPIEEGMTVEAGQKLLALDPTDVMLEIESTEAKIRQQDHQIAFEEEGITLALARADETEATLWRQIEAAEANRRSAAAALKSAEADWTRAKGLRSSGAVSQAQYDAAEAAWRTAKEALTAQTHTLEQLTVGADKASRERLTKTGSAEGMALETVTNARREAEIRRVNLAAMRAARDELAAALKTLQVNRTRLEIAAPERAKVISVLYELGELVSPNAPAVLLETERRYVDVYVPEDRVAGFTEGTEVPCFVPALDETVTGTVQTTDAAPDFADLKMVRERGQADLKLFKVRIEIPATEGLLTGMTVEVRP